MDAGWPDGFVYRPDFVSEAEERALIAGMATIEFGEVKMHGVIARRRVAHFGWLYGYESWRVEPGPPLPAFLHGLRERAVTLAAVGPDDLAETLVTEYPPGAGIGWHRDAPMFGVVIGISLGAPCRFRFQRGKSGARETRAVVLEARSAYALTGPARSAWQHCISPTKATRYSVTFRTLRERRRGSLSSPRSA